MIGSAATLRLRTALASARARAILQTAAGGAIVVAVVQHAGAAPFLRGLTSVTPAAILAALVLTAIATSAAVWRWRVVARGLGIPLAHGAAMGAYYRSQFLNSVLPGGILGDVDRAVGHARATERFGLASRAVAGERGAGQIVQIALAAACLVPLGVSAYAPAVGVVLLAVVVACVAIVVAAAASGRVRAVALRELRLAKSVVAGPRAIASIVVASVVVIACHVATFAVATVAVGAAATPQQLAAVGLVAVLAGSIPLNVGGWGPREGAAAAAFGMLGLGTSTGIAASTAFGVIVLIAVTPGALVLAASVLRRRAAVVPGSSLALAREEVRT